jgi:hypothetical protein
MGETYFAREMQKNAFFLLSLLSPNFISNAVPILGGSAINTSNGLILLAILRQYLPPIYHLFRTIILIFYDFKKVRYQYITLSRIGQ